VGSIGLGVVLFELGVVLFELGLVDAKTVL
jgi:hypothetical protein